MSDDQGRISLDEFPDETREDVEGLIWLGHLEDDFEYCGHRFSIRTLKADEELYAGLLVKEYQDSLSQGKAWAWANVAMALESVDGDEDFCPPIGPDRQAHAKARFRFVTSKWYWPVAEFIFNRYLLLIQRQQIAVKAIQDLSQENRANFSPSPDFSTDQGDSEKQEEAQEIERYLED